MEQTIYFQDKSLTFSRVQAPSADFVIPSGEAGSLTRAKVLKIFETHNSLVALSNEPEAAFRRFSEEFTGVEAAGGVVVNPRGEWLMIRRNGRWDLPKGHVEPGESFDRCAEREIEEETVVRYLSRLLLPADRALGTETYPLVPLACHRTPIARAANRGGHRGGGLVQPDAD